MPARNFIVTADDFGITNKISEGMMNLAQSGIIHRLSLLTNMPGTDRALNLAKENPAIPIGLHVNLTEGRPLTQVCKGLVDLNGNFYSRRTLLQKLVFNRISRNEVLEELHAQFDRIQKAGVAVTYLDSHQHIHVFPVVSEIFQAFARQNGLLLRLPEPSPLRANRSLSHHFLRMLLKWNPIPDELCANQSLSSIFDLGKTQIQVKDYQVLKENSPSSGIHEFMVHPYLRDEAGLLEVYGQNGLIKKSGFLNLAYQEFELLHDEEVRGLLTR